MPKKIFKVKAVIFDMDGVITNTMPYHYKAWKAIFGKENLPMTKLDIYLREGQQGFESVKGILQKYAHPISDERINEILRAKEALFKKIVKIRFITGTRSLLRMLYKSGFKLAIVTGTSRDEAMRILPERIKNYFSVIITGNDVKYGKPNPEPYKKALEKLNLNPTGAIVIENAPLGIESAKKAGLKCLSLETSLPRKYLQEADCIFENIKELLDKIKFIPYEN